MLTYQIRKLSLKDKPFLEILVRRFLEESPLYKHLHLTYEDKYAKMQALVQLAINSEISCGAFVKETADMCGLTILSSPRSRALLQSNSFSCEPSKSVSHQLLTLSRFQDFMKADIFDFVGSDNYLMLEVGYVLPEYQKKNISKEMRQLCYTVGSQCSSDAVVVVAVSEYIAKLFIKEGFIPVKTIFYNDYCDTITGEALFNDLYSVCK